MKLHFGPLLLFTALMTFLWMYIENQIVIPLMIAILLVSGVYVLGLVRVWRNAGTGHGMPVWRAACFLAGMAILALALSSPMDNGANRAFSIHMIQHMLLMKVVAPLLLLGEFMPVYLWAIGKGAAHWASGTWTRSRSLSRFWAQLTQPGASWILFALCLWVWHTPAFYQAALKNESLHALEHLLFLGTSLLFWWYLLQTGRDQAVRYGMVILYLFTTLLHESVLGALLTFSSRNWYPFYSATNPSGLTPLADQQLAGVIMWLPSGILFGLLIIFYFGAWLKAIEKRMQAAHPEFAHTGERNE